MNLLLLIVYSLAVFAAALFGAWIPRRLHMTHTRTQMMMSLVSGLMLGVALYHLVPHSLAGSGHIDFTMQWVMVGLVFMLLLLRLFHFHQHEFAPGVDACDHDHGHDHDHQHEHRHGHADHAHGSPPHDASGVTETGARQHVHAGNDLPQNAPARAADSAASPGRYSWVGLFLGLGIHTLVDGVAIGAVMRTDSWGGGLLGVGVFLAVLLHKPLDALSIETVMASAGWSDQRRTQVNWVFAVLCPLAAFGFYFGVDLTSSTPLLMPAALAFSAGAFICIALGDLLPEVQFHSHDRVKLTVLFLLGIGLAWAIGLLEPDHAGHDHGSAGRVMERQVE
ncbi:MAG: ZIP family metal transporter [Halieaceae bacterium]|jgi:zinc and cadmium transporter|nr:ZIP family metal transporter [Halieaceae bacterium]